MKEEDRRRKEKIERMRGKRGGRTKKRGKTKIGNNIEGMMEDERGGTKKRKENVGERKGVIRHKHNPRRHR